MAISLGSRLLGSSSSLPGSPHGPDQSACRAGRPRVARPGTCFLFGFAPCGVYLARLVTQPAGELLPHRSPLTGLRGDPRAPAVCFLLHFPWPRGRWALPTTVSYGARTFLPPQI